MLADLGTWIWQVFGIEPHRLFLVLVLVIFIISGRKFLDAWKDGTSKGRRHRLAFAGLFIVCFLIVAFFETQF